MVSNFQNKLQAKIFLQVQVAAGKSQRSSSWCLFWVTDQCDVPGGCWMCCPPPGWWVHPVEPKPQTSCKSEYVLTKRGRANVPLLPPTPCERLVHLPQSSVCWSNAFSYLSRPSLALEKGFLQRVAVLGGVFPAPHPVFGGRGVRVSAGPDLTHQVN